MSYKKLLGSTIGIGFGLSGLFASLFSWQTGINSGAIMGYSVGLSIVLAFLFSRVAVKLARQCQYSGEQ